MVSDLYVQHDRWRHPTWPGHPEPLLRPHACIGGIVLGFQRCSGPYLPTCQACSTQIGSGRVLYLRRALRLGLFFVEFVAAARRHNTYISVRLGASSRYHSAPLPRSSAHALHHRSHKAFRTSAAHKRSNPRRICFARLHFTGPDQFLGSLSGLFTFHHCARAALVEAHPSPVRSYNLRPPQVLASPPHPDCFVQLRDARLLRVAHRQRDHGRHRRACIQLVGPRRWASCSWHRFRSRPR